MKKIVLHGALLVAMIMLPVPFRAQERVEVLSAVISGVDKTWEM